jgi:hypothetical protein
VIWWGSGLLAVCSWVVWFGGSVFLWRFDVFYLFEVLYMSTQLQFPFGIDLHLICFTRANLQSNHKGIATHPQLLCVISIRSGLEARLSTTFVFEKFRYTDQNLTQATSNYWRRRVPRSGFSDWPAQ